MAERTPGTAADAPTPDDTAARPDRAATRRRRQLTVAVRDALGEVNIQLALLNRRFGGRVELRDIDWTCLHLINRLGPISPTALAHRAGIHPATLTGILDRLQKGGWVVRERDPHSADRRAVTLRPVRERNAALFELFSGMNHRMEVVCEDYSEAELEIIADFLHRTATAGGESAQELAAD